VVTWDSDGSSDSDDSNDDGKKSIKKALASIATNNKSSIFDTLLTCRMAKPTKVKYDVSVIMNVKVMVVGVMMMRSTPRRSS
jgi:hypothetical protein